VSITKLLALVAACSIAVLGITACGDDDDGNGGGASEESAAVTITSPEDGSTATDTVTANVDLEGFEIDAASVGMANAEGKGHLHFSLDAGQYDSSKYSGPNGKLAEQLGTDGQYSPSTQPTITYRGLPRGEHTLKVELVNNDHSSTGISDSVTFAVG
jgi:hypothetical protein